MQVPGVRQDVHWQNGDVEDDRRRRISDFCVCLRAVWSTVGGGVHPENRRKNILRKCLRVPFVPIGYKSERVGTAEEAARKALCDHASMTDEGESCPRLAMQPR